MVDGYAYDEDDDEDDGVGNLGETKETLEKIGLYLSVIVDILFVLI